MKLSFLLFSVHLARAPVAGTSVVTPTPCKDDPEFRFKQERDKTCEWVAEKPLERCEKEWKRIEITVDSGAYDNVCSEDLLPELGVKATEASNNKEFFYTASTQKTYNKREKIVKGAK